jgi:hypothetical protein
MIPIICIIFIGHSNMTGHCQPKIDTTERVLFWSDTRGFFPYTERMESPVTPIIRKLNASGNVYAALNVSHMCMHVKEPLPELFEHIERIKRLPNVKFGGVVTMLGQPMAREYYCNGHHYNKQGYDLFASEAVRLLR